MPPFLCPYQYGLLLVTFQLPSAGAKKRGYVYVIAQSCHILRKFYSAFWFFELCHFIIPVGLDQHLPVPCHPMVWPFALKSTSIIDLSAPHLKSLEIILSTLKMAVAHFFKILVSAHKTHGAESQDSSKQNSLKA